MKYKQIYIFKIKHYYKYLCNGFWRSPYVCEEGLCPSSGNINGLMIMINIYNTVNINYAIRLRKFRSKSGLNLGTAHIKTNEN
jgi:hypothetical protein